MSSSSFPGLLSKWQQTLVHAQLESWPPSSSFSLKKLLLRESRRESKKRENYGCERNIDRWHQPGPQPRHMPQRGESVTLQVGGTTLNLLSPSGWGRQQLLKFADKVLAGKGSRWPLCVPLGAGPRDDSLGEDLDRLLEMLALFSVLLGGT